MGGMVIGLGTGVPRVARTLFADDETPPLLRTYEVEMKTSYSNQFQKAFSHFKSDAAGKRFLNLYRTTRKLKPIVRVMLGGMGLVLGICGLLLGLVPGVPGIVLGVLGFALVAAQFRGVAESADRAEVATREFWADMRSHITFLKETRKARRKAPSRKSHRVRTASAA